MREIAIIGGGIGGLSTAIALKQQGLKTTIFEQSPIIKSVGAGIILANNAMQVYDKLGLRDEIENCGNHIASMNITHSNLKPISKIDLTFFEKKYHVKNMAIHRGKLQQILMDKLGIGELKLGHKLQKIESSEIGHSLKFENGTEIHPSVLIGADGIKSKVRQQLFPGQVIRKAQQVCWRGVTNYQLPSAYSNELNEAWGGNDRFGFVQLAPGLVYWYALKSFKRDQNEFHLDQIAGYFKQYHSLIHEIIKATPINQINTAEISDLKPIHHWYQKNVCLIGDAAHATTPNMGQGACQAIEDAYVLAQCFNKYEGNIIFQQFQKLRMPKAHQVVKTSWQIGKIAHLKSPVLRVLRNQLMRMTPAYINRKKSEQIFQLTSL